MKSAMPHSPYPTHGIRLDRTARLVAFEVDNLEEAVSELKKAGVTFVADHIESPVCSFALIADPDGNGITIHKRKPGSSH
jgi:predicted enzyme related to lactoylglutathione lyase